MKFVLLLLAAASFCATAAAFADSMTWSKGGDMCMGWLKDCDEIQACTEIAVGACPTSTAGEDMMSSEAPAWAIRSSFSDFGMINEASPSTIFSRTDDSADVEATMESIEGGKDFYRDQALAQSVKDLEGKVIGKTSFSMTGKVFGDLGIAGCYLGMASSVNAGESYSASTTEAYFASSDNLKQVTRGDSKLGAPHGPMRGCLEAVDAEGKCLPRVVHQSAYKFSIFGYVSGTQFAKAMTDYAAGGYDHATVTMEMTSSKEIKLVQFITTDDELATLEDVGNSNIKTILLTSVDDDQQMWDFPQKYNVGSTAGALESGAAHLPVTATRDVKIKVTQAGLKSTELTTKIYVVTLFDIADVMNPETYFLYDPDQKTPSADEVKKMTTMNRKGTAVAAAECEAGNKFNKDTGKAPCAACNACTANGVKTACLANADTVCKAAPATEEPAADTTAADAIKDALKKAAEKAADAKNFIADALKLSTASREVVGLASLFALAATTVAAW